MLKLMSIGSGSTGNCLYVCINGMNILIDLGLNAKTICSALDKIGLKPADIDAVLITHTHSDHISAVNVMKKRLNCQYLMSSLSYNHLFISDTTVLVPGCRTQICGCIYVTAFETDHDCPGSIGFRLDSDSGSLGYATDLGHVSPEVRHILAGADTVIIESNHDVKMLREGSYPFVLKRRILSESGHLSNDDCAEMVRYLAEHGTGNFFLAHLSRENNTPQAALETVSPALAEYPDANLNVFGQYCGSLICIE